MNQTTIDLIPDSWEEYDTQTICLKINQPTLKSAFSKWRRFNLMYSILPKGTRVQVKCSEWLWGEIVDYDGNYSIRFDNQGIFKGIPRDKIKPCTRLIRSGQVIDWNFIEPSRKQRLIDKFGSRPRRSDFE